MCIRDRPIIGDISSVLFNEEIFDFIIEHEKTYRNRFLLTPFEWNEKIKELYFTAEDRWSRSSDTYQLCYDRILASPSIRISGGLKRKDGPGELMLHVIHHDLIDQENFYLLSNNESIDIPIGTDILAGSELRINIPAHWDNVSLVQGETFIQGFPFLLDIPVIITFDGDLVPVDSLNGMVVSRPVSDLWINEIVWKSSTSTLHLEISGQSFGENQYSVHVNSNPLWSIDWTPDYDIGFQDSTFTVDSLDPGNIILSWNLIRDDEIVPMEFVIIEDSTEVMRHRFPDGGPWQSVEYSTLGMKNQNIISDSQTALIPELFVLYQNFPNPFNNNTRITFDLLQDAIISLYVTDATGRVKTIFTENEYKELTGKCSATYLKSRNQLIEVGFIEQTHRGGTCRGDRAMYSVFFGDKTMPISKQRWRRYPTENWAHKIPKTKKQLVGVNTQFKKGKSARKLKPTLQDYTLNVANVPIEVDPK